MYIKEAPIFWIGPRESDIEGVEHLYKGSITIFGSNELNNTSYHKKDISRLNHNMYDEGVNNFLKIETTKIIHNEPNAYFMFYNPNVAFSLGNSIIKKTICLNDYEILNFLRSKINSRLVYSNIVPVIKSKLILGIDCNIETFKDHFGKDRRYVIQSDSSAGGFGTLLMSATNEKVVKSRLNKHKTYIVSPYLEKSIPINIHLVISSSEMISSIPSVQIIEEQDSMLLYKGADFISYNYLDNSLKNEIESHSKKIGEHLKRQGYLGICGIDFIVTKGKVFFQEINNRFQSSSSLINKALLKEGLPSINELTIEAFYKDNLSFKKLNTIKVNASCYSILYKNNENYINTILKASKNEDAISNIILDGYDSETICEPNSYILKIEFNTNITSINKDYKINLHDNLKDEVDHKTHSLQELKFRLLNQGIVISKQAKEYIETIGGFNEAVFNAIDISINNKLHVNSPINVKFSSLSPFGINWKNNKFILTIYDKEVCEVQIEKKDLLAHEKTTSNIDFSIISKLATDRLRIHHQPICYFKETNTPCLFCDLPKTGQRFTIQDIKEVIDAYLNKNSFNHFLIGGGSAEPNTGWNKKLEIVKHIRSKSSKAIYLMSLPTVNFQLMKQLHNAGVTEIGFNIEIFDAKIAQETMLGKGKLPRQLYYEALKEAVKIWGNTGQVRSLVVLGFDSTEVFLKGIEKLCSIGVSPIISIFRPMPNTSFSQLIPPSYNYINYIFKEVSSICKKYNLKAGPQCVFCQNNTLSMPDYLLSDVN